MKSYSHSKENTKNNDAAGEDRLHHHQEAQSDNFLTSLLKDSLLLDPDFLDEDDSDTPVVEQSPVIRQPMPEDHLFQLTVSIDEEKAQTEIYRVKKELLLYMARETVRKTKVNNIKPKKTAGSTHKNTSVLPGVRRKLQAKQFLTGKKRQPLPQKKHLTKKPTAPKFQAPATMQLDAKENRSKIKIPDRIKQKKQKRPDTSGRTICLTYSSQPLPFTPADKPPAEKKEKKKQTWRLTL